MYIYIYMPPKRLQGTQLAIALKEEEIKILRGLIQRQERQKRQKNARILGEIAELESKIKQRQQRKRAVARAPVRHQVQAPARPLFPVDEARWRQTVQAYSNPAVWANTPPAIAQELWRQLVSGNLSPNVNGYTLPFIGLI
jgi:hypothetical protein